MANTFTNIIPKIMDRGLSVLRENTIMARLVNGDFSDEARERGDTIDIPSAGAITTRNVTPGQTGTNQDSAESKVQISLNQWKEATFYLTDKEVLEVDSPHVSRKVDEAVKSLANTLDSFVLGLYTGIYKHAGTAGTTPFSGNNQTALAAFKTARVRLNDKNQGRGPAPMDNRRVVLDPDAEGNALTMSAFRAADETGSQEGIIRGNIGMKLGSDWFMDQNVPTHTAGTLSHTTAVLTVAAYTAGATTMSWDRATLTGTVVTGDVFRIPTLGGGRGRDFTVSATATAGSNSIVVTFTPSIQEALASGITVVPVASNHAVNLHFQRDAIGLAIRTAGLTTAVPSGGSTILTQVDPISGIPLRLEIQRQWRQTTWAFDMLYGATLVNPELAARIMG